MSVPPSYYTYCFDFFAPQNLALFCNLAADLLGEYPFLPRSVERLCLIFLWIFDLTAYHANELEKLPSSWPDWIPKAGILASTLFWAFGLSLAMKLPSNKRVVPLVLLVFSGLVYYFDEWHGRTLKEVSDRHGQRGLGVYVHSAFCLFQLSVIYAAKEDSTATGKEKLN